MKLRTLAAKYGPRMAAIAAAPMVLVGTAHAALPAAAEAAITEYKTDALAAVGLVTAAGVVVWGALKLASKLGWR